MPADKATLALLETLAASPAGSPAWQQARDSVVADHHGLVIFCAQKFTGRGEPLEDLVQIGMEGLLKAVDRFDLTQGVALSTYAVPLVVGEIRRHLRDRSDAVRVPRTITDRYPQVLAAAEDLERELDRSPTPDEVAQRCGLGREVVLEAMDAYRTTTVSLEAPSTPGASTAPVLETIADSSSALEEVEVATVLSQALDELSDRDRELVVLRLEHELSQSEIAERVGLSQMQVSRILSRFGKRLRQDLVAA